MKKLVIWVWNSATLMTWASFTARSGSLLLVTPLIIVRFSEAEIALWFFFLTITSLQMMADFGFGPSFTRAIAYAAAGRRRLDSAEDLLPGENTELLAHIYAVLQRCYRRLALVGFGVGLTLGTWVTIKPVSELAHPSQGWLAWIIVLACSTGMFRNGAFAIWLQGRNRIAQLRRTETILSLGTMFATAAAIWLSGSFLVSVVVSQGTTLLASLAIRLLARSAIPLHAETVGVKARQAIFRYIWPAAWRSGVGVLMSSAVIQASGVVYAQFGPTAKVAAYLFAMRIMQTILQISMAPFYSKIPLFASLYGAGREAELLPTVRKAMAHCHWVFTVGLIGVNFLIEPLLSIIGSKTTFVPDSLWATMGLAYLIERIGAMHMQFYSLSNHILWHIANGISGVIYLAVSFSLIKVCGAYAFPVAMIVAYLGFYTWFALRLTSKHYNFNVLVFESRSALIPAAIILTLVSVYCLSPYLRFG